jgi:hypothetical protein
MGDGSTAYAGVNESASHGTKRPFSTNRKLSKAGIHRVKTRSAQPLVHFSCPFGLLAKALVFPLVLFNTVPNATLDRGV